MTLTFLGTGTSHGVPSIDCMVDGYVRCPKGLCRKALGDSRFRRTRSSVMLEYGGKRVLIDVSSDFREQCLREGVRGIDAVLVTHAHADHIAGLPDIRSYTRPPGPPLPLWGTVETIEAIRRSYSYVFDPDAFVGGGIPRLEPMVVDGPFDLFGLPVTPIPVVHGPLPGCVGFRIGGLGYVPDMKEMPERSRDLLRGLDCLVLNCLRCSRPHATHLTLPESMELARELSPRKCFFTHLSHDVDFLADAAGLDRIDYQRLNSLYGLDCHEQVRKLAALNEPGSLQPEVITV